MKNQTLVTEKQNKYINKKMLSMTESEMIQYNIDTNKAKNLGKIPRFREFFDLKIFMFLAKKYESKQNELMGKIQFQW